MSKMDDLLKGMLFDAVDVPGHSISRKLENGLRITVQKGADSLVLTIARGNGYPSMIEWAVVKSHFPYRVSKALVPEQVMLPDGWRALRGRVPNPEVVQLKFA